MSLVDIPQGLLKWGGTILFSVGLFFTVWMVVGNPEGLPHKSWMRYTVHLEHKLRLMFLFTSGNLVASVQLAGIFAVFALNLLVDVPVWYLICAAIAGGPPWYIERMRRKRIELIEEQLDGFLTAMGSALKTTPSIGDALNSVSTLLHPPISKEIELAVKEMRVGSTLDQALLNLAGRVGSRQIDSALSAILIGRQIGGDLPRILDTTADTLREMARLEGVIRTKTAEGKAQMWVLALFPFVLMAGLDSMNEGYFLPLTQSVVGYAVAVVAGAFWLASLIVARKVLAVDI